MEASEQRSSVPPELKKLVRLIGRSFYQPLQIVCLDVLSTYPCVTEGDLVEVLRMHGSQRQLRQALTFLRKDKIIKSQQRIEGDAGLIHYYYINYKHFVNVVKYKLDQIRRRIETEERRVQNRTSYRCTSCGSPYSDLDVDRLFNPADSSLRCSYCSSILEEDAHDKDMVDSRTLISRLNDQIRPITELLKKTENVNLAPEVLEPEPQSIRQVSDPLRRSQSGSRDTDSWSKNRPTINIYGESADISVHVGSQESIESKGQSKAIPEWMAKSTIQQANSSSEAEEKIETTSSQREKKDDQMMVDLLRHETQGDLHKETVIDPGRERSEYSSSGSESDDEMEDVYAWNTGGYNEEDDDESDSEAFTVKIGNDTVPLHEVTGAMVAQMTEEEKDHYKHVYQQASSLHADDM